MPATTQNDPLPIPTRFRTGVKALVAKLGLVADLVVIENPFQDPVKVIVQDKTRWPDGTKRLAIVDRGLRAPSNPQSQGERGTTADENRGAVAVWVFVRDDDVSTLLDELDKAEAEVVNAMRALLAQTQSEQTQWDLFPKRLVPVATRNQGGVFPYAGTRIEAELWSHE